MSCPPWILSSLSPSVLSLEKYSESPASYQAEQLKCNTGGRHHGQGRWLQRSVVLDSEPRIHHCAATWLPPRAIHFTSLGFSFLTCYLKTHAPTLKDHGALNEILTVKCLSHLRHLMSFSASFLPESVGSQSFKASASSHVKWEWKPYSLQS